MGKMHITLMKQEMLVKFWLEDLTERVRLGDEDLDGRVKGKQVLNIRRDIDEHCASTMRSQLRKLLSWCAFQPIPALHGGPPNKLFG
jgi:hypothetical protein